MGNHRHEQGYLASIASGFLFAGLLMGGLIGATAMLLFAPQSGEKTRDQIQKEGLKLRDQVTESVEDAVTQASGKAHRVVARVQKEAGKLQQRGEVLLDEQRQVVSRAVEAEKAAVRDIANG